MTQDTNLTESMMLEAEKIIIERNDNRPSDFADNVAIMAFEEVRRLRAAPADATAEEEANEAVLKIITVIGSGNWNRERAQMADIVQDALTRAAARAREECIKIANDLKTQSGNQTDRMTCELIVGRIRAGRNP